MAFPTTDLVSKVEINIGGTWTDVTTYVLYDQGAGIKVTNGLGPEDLDKGQPAEVSFTLDNSDGRFSPRNASSPYAGWLKFGLQVRASYDLGSGASQRGQGEVYEFKPALRNDGTKTMRISAKSPEWRVFNAPRPLASPMYATYVADTPVILVPLEDATATPRPQIAYGAGKAVVAGTATWADNADLPGAKPLPTFNTTTYFRIDWDNTTMSQQRWQVEIWMFIPVAPVSRTVMLRIYTNSATAPYVDYVQNSTSYELDGIAQDGSTLWTTGGFANGLEIGGWRRVRVMAQQNGANVDYNLRSGSPDGSGAVVISKTVAGTVGAPGAAAVIGGQATMPAIAAGYFSVWDGYNFIPTSTDSAGNGFLNEWPSNRWLRVLREMGYSDGQYRHGGGVVPLMGRQATSDAVTVLQETVDLQHAFTDTDKQGRIRYTNITYVSNNVDATQSPALTVDWSTSDISDLQISDSVTTLWNEVTATAANGASLTVQQLVGRYTVDDPPTGIGRRPVARTYNLADPTDLRHHATWELRRGAVDAPTVLKLVIQMERASKHASVAALLAAWPALDTGAWIRIQNTAVQAGQDPIDIVMLGFEEWWTQKSLQVTIYGKPISTYHIHRIEQGDERIDSDHTRLLHALGTGDTSVRICDVYDYYFPVKWAHRDGNYPIRITPKIEDMTVTAVADGTPSFVAAGTAVHADNASLTPGLPAGIQKGDDIYLLAAIRNTAAGFNGITNPGGWTQLVDQGNVGLFHQIWDGSFGAPTVAFTGGSAGDTTSAFTFAFRNVSGRLLAEPATLVNGSAQNIAGSQLLAQVIKRHAPLLLFFGWKQDDWTSVAAISGWTQIASPSTTTGNDQGLVAYYVFTGESVNTGTVTAVVTGGASAISKSAMLAVDTNVQILTVTRAANGIAASHIPGGEVHVKNPIMLSLF